MDYQAFTYRMPTTTYTDTITRVRPIIYKTLKNRWQDKKRPKQTDGNLRHAAIAVDSSSFEIFKPSGKFDETKCYFDGKNHIYALKKRSFC